jgi:hypothetical protein
MDPDVVGAVARLRAESILTVGQAALFDRVARRKLVSVRLEIRALLYVGVLLLTSGVGLLAVEHHREIGPWTIAGGIALTVAACLLWVVRTAPPFSWGEVPSPSVAFDYVVLLALLLFAADLAFVEAQLTVLGPSWAYHLLVVGVVYLLAAYRWDSRTALGLGLATLAAWRGLSLGLVSGSLEGPDSGPLRLNALALGALYVAAAALSVRLARKAHFEDVFANAGLLLLLSALVFGAYEDGASGRTWLVALLVVATLAMWLAFRLGRSLYLAQAVMAAYVGLLRLVFEPFRRTESSIPFMLAALLAVGALVLISTAHRRMRER